MRELGRGEGEAVSSTLSSKRKEDEPPSAGLERSRESQGALKVGER
jgi:hypothetical protein